jgi:signal transduction histidine kinase
VGLLASQVAHDIRSPLAALEMVNEELSALPEDLRLLVRNAVGRIKDISNNLLESNRSAHSKLQPSMTPLRLWTLMRRLPSPSSPA